MPALRSCLLILLLLGGPAGAIELSEAEALLQRGDVGGALAAARARAAEAPADVEAHELIIDLLLAAGQGRLAAERYAQLAREKPQDADRQYLLGRATMDPSDSEIAFRTALKLRPGHPRALTGLAAVHRSRGELDAATSAYEQALKTDPQLSEAWAGLRAVQMSRQDTAGLAAVALRAVEAAPDDAQSWLAAAAVVPGRAIELLQKGARRLPRSAEIQLSLGRAAFDARDWQTASAAYAKALSLGTADDASVRVEQALVGEILAGAISPEGARDLLQIRGIDDPVSALDRLDRLVGAHPHSGWARLVRGNLRSSRGAIGAAEEDLRAALDRMPATPEAWSALGGLLLGQHRAAEARPLLDRAARARPDDVSLVVAAAMAAAEAGDLATAEKELHAARLRFPGSSGPPLGLTRLLLSAGKPDAAFEVLEEALARRPDVQLVSALVSSAQEAGRPAEAVTILYRLADRTGDPRLRQVAQGLEERNRTQK